MDKIVSPTHTTCNTFIGCPTNGNQLTTPTELIIRPLPQLAKPVYSKLKSDHQAILKSIIKDHNLSPSLAATLCALANHINEYGVTLCSWQKIAYETNQSIHTIANHAAKLQKMGIIYKKKRGWQQTNITVILAIQHWNYNKDARSECNILNTLNLKESISNQTLKEYDNYITNNHTERIPRKKAPPEVGQIEINEILNEMLSASHGEVSKVVREQVKIYMSKNRVFYPRALFEKIISRETERHYNQFNEHEDQQRYFRAQAQQGIDNTKRFTDGEEKAILKPRLDYILGECGRRLREAEKNGRSNIEDK